MIQDLIESNVIFTGKRSGKGWRHVKCQTCNDYKDRGAFLFSDNVVNYNCFNCGTKSFAFEGSTRIPHDMRKILNDFGITNDAIDTELAKNFLNQTGDGLTLKKKNPNELVCVTPTIDLPNSSYPLESADPEDIWTIVAKEYLESRGLSSSSHKWYLSSDKKFRDRLIIPFYRNNQVIYWQARSFDDAAKERYVNPGDPQIAKGSILFGYDELNAYTDKPMFIMEGPMDAISIGGVALLGSEIAKCQQQALTRCRRKKIFVIDKDDNGLKLGRHVLNLGWAITFISGEASDVNAAVSRYGKLWTIQNLMENVHEGFEGQVYIETVCRKIT